MPRQHVRFLASRTAPALLWTLGWVGLGCGSTDSDTGSDNDNEELPEMIPVAGCEGFDLSNCNVVETDCQQEVMGLVSCLRGNDSADLPPVRTISPDEYRGELEAEAASEDPPDTRFELALTWLDLVEPDGLSTEQQIDTTVDNVVAYYSPERQDITLVLGDGSVAAQDQERATSTLAHETVHALQDGDVDLDAQQELFASSYDSWLGLRSVVEGEAEVYQTIIDAALWGLRLQDVSLSARFEQLCRWTAESVIAAPNPFLETLYSFPYSFGGRYVNAELETNGNAAVRALPTAPPGGTLPIILLNQEPVDAEPWPDVPLEPDGYEPVVWDSLGAWLLYVYLSRDALTPADAAVVANNWVADRFWVYGEVYVLSLLWRLRVTDPATAEQLAAAIPPHTTSVPWSVRVSGNEVMLGMTNGGFDLDAWLDSVLAE